MWNGIGSPSSMYSRVPGGYFCRSMPAGWSCPKWRKWQISKFVHFLFAFWPNSYYPNRTPRARSAGAGGLLLARFSERTSSIKRGSLPQTIGALPSPIVVFPSTTGRPGIIPGTDCLGVFHPGLFPFHTAICGIEPARAFKSPPHL